jgi:hypothetical protein
LVKCYNTCELYLQVPESKLKGVVRAQGLAPLLLN